MIYSDSKYNLRQTKELVLYISKKIPELSEHGQYASHQRKGQAMLGDKDNVPTKYGVYFH